MKIEGILKEIGEIRWFDSQKNGKTAAREIVMESEGRFPEVAVLQVTGNDAEKFEYAIGTKLTCHFRFGQTSTMTDGSTNCKYGK